MADETTVQLADDLQSHYAAFTLAFPDLTEPLNTHIDQLTERLTRELRDGDDSERADAARTILDLLDPDDDWWTTPQGRLVASAVQTAGETVTYARAARMLGIQRGTVSTLVQRGKLESVPGDGVLLESVFRRLAAETD